MSATIARCAECGWRGAVPPVAACPLCGSRQLRTNLPGDALADDVIRIARGTLRAVAPGVSDLLLAAASRYLEARP